MKIKEESYSSGIVCFLDILGFKSVAENEDNFKSLKDIYNKILNKEIIINNYMEYKDLILMVIKLLLTKCLYLECLMPVSGIREYDTLHKKMVKCFIEW